jgi:ketosteroid isomerase-like protein
MSIFVRIAAEHSPARTKYNARPRATAAGPSAQKETIVSDQTNSKQSKAVVDAYYQAGVRGRLTDFARYLHPDFLTTAPNYLPWGGVHPGAAFFRDEVLPNLPDVLDFRRFSYEALFAEHDRVVALVNFGVTGTHGVVQISEHWTVREDKATSIWVAYFEPQTLLEKLGIAHGLGPTHA